MSAGAFSRSFATTVANLLIALAVTHGVACTSKNQEAPVDTGAMPAPDGSSDDTPGDAADEASFDGAVVRKLIEAPFMEGLPVDDRFVDPLFQDAGSTWFEYDPTGGTAPVHVERRVLPRAPVGQSTLYVPGRTSTENLHGVSVIGGVKLADSTHEGSLWVGSIGPTTVRVALLAVDPLLATKNGVFSFAVDKASARDIDGIHWVRHQVATPRGPLGWGFVLITVNGTGNTYLHAPVMRSTTGTSALVVSGPSRSPTLIELQLMRRVADDQRRVPRGSWPPR